MNTSIKHYIVSLMDKPKYLPWVFVLALMSACMEVDVSVPSFPDIARYFSASEGRVQLSIAYTFLGFLLAARFIQGIGASTSAVLVFAMIADRYQGAENIRLVGFMNACLSLL